MQQERPDEVNAALIDFLKSLKATQYSPRPLRISRGPRGSIGA